MYESYDRNYYGFAFLFNVIININADSIYNKTFLQ